MKICVLVCLALFVSTDFSFGQSGNYKIHMDLLYAGNSDSLQSLNLVLPEADTESFPLLVWIGGGAWSYGDKNQEMDLGEKFADAGIAVASIGHRLSPAIWRDSTLSSGIQHPKHVEDVAAAVSWLINHADSYGYDSEKLFIGGFSSGGHLAALLVLDPSYLDSYGLSPKLFKGMIPISGAYDIINYHEVFLNGNSPELAEEHVDAVFGSGKKAHQNASPVNYLEQLSVPILLMSDGVVYRYSKLFEDRILETEFRDLQVVYAYALSHADLWKDLSFAENSKYREIIISFIQIQLKTR